MSNTLSFRFSDELKAKVEAESDRRKVTISDVIRQAVEEYFNREQERQNFDALIYEEAKTRAVVLRCFDMAGKELKEELLEEAGKDAEFYLEKRKKKE